MMATIDNLRTIQDYDVAWAVAEPPTAPLATASHDRRGRLNATTALDRRAWTLPTVAFGAALLAASPAFPLPTGIDVQQGDVTVSEVSPTRLDITVNSDAIVNFESFSINMGEVVNVLKGSGIAVPPDALFRVVGPNASRIDGVLNGSQVNLVLVNPNGINVGPAGSIDVNSIVLSTIDIENGRFMAGEFEFGIHGKARAKILNEGTINVAEGGLVALVAPGVENTGTINARLGKVSLASGNKFTLDFYGDGLVQVALDDKVTEAALGDGKALVENSGRIYADGGVVQLSAAAAKGVVDNVINMTGVVRAQSVTQTATGEIILDGGENGAVNVAGTLDASGLEGAQKGGRIQVSGEKVEVADAAIVDASGAAGGGTVLVGAVSPRLKPSLSGDRAGAPRSFPTETVAAETRVAETARIRADATGNGDGGYVEVNSTSLTAFYGEITAMGGATGGDGGFVEVSSAGDLTYAGHVDTSAAAGETGTLLIDPTRLTICNQCTSGNGFILDSDLANELEANNVTLLASGRGVGEGPGEIIFQDGIRSLRWRSGNDLTVIADDNTGGNVAGGRIRVGSDTIIGDNAGRPGIEITFRAGTVELDDAALLADSVVFETDALEVTGLESSPFQVFADDVTIRRLTPGTVGLGDGAQARAADLHLSQAELRALAYFSTERLRIGDPGNANLNLTQANNVTGIIVEGVDLGFERGTRLDRSLGTFVELNAFGNNNARISFDGVNRFAGLDANAALAITVGPNFRDDPTITTTGVTFFDPNTRNVSDMPAGHIALNSEVDVSVFGEVVSNGGDITIDGVNFTADFKEARIDAGSGLIDVRSTGRWQSAESVFFTSNPSGLLLRVDSNSPGQGFATIQEAIDSIGDVTGRTTIAVAAGTYDPFVVDEARVTVSGAGFYGANPSIVSVAASNLVVAGNRDAVGATVTASDVVIERLLFQGTRTPGETGVLIDGEATPGLTGVRILDNGFADLDFGVDSRGDIGRLVIGGADDSVFEDIGTTAIRLAQLPDDVLIADLVIRDSEGEAHLGGGPGDADRLATGSHAIQVGAAGDGQLTLAFAYLTDIGGSGVDIGGALTGRGRVEILATEIEAFDNAVRFRGDITDNATVEITNNSTLRSLGDVIEFDNAIGGVAEVRIVGNGITSVATGESFGEGVEIASVTGDAVVEIRNNRISAEGNGIEFDGTIGGSARVDVIGNTVTVENHGIVLPGFDVDDGPESGNGVFDTATVTLRDNDIVLLGENGTGYGLANIGSNNAVTISGGTVTGGRAGLAVLQRVEELIGKIVIDGVEIENARQAGLQFFGLSQFLAFEVDIGGGTTVTGGGHGLEFDGTGFALTDDALGDIAFDELGGDYIRLLNGALDNRNSVTEIDATRVSFDGTRGADGPITISRFDEIEARLVHNPDDPRTDLLVIGAQGTAPTGPAIDLALIDSVLTRIFEDLDEARREAPPTTPADAAFGDTPGTFPDGNDVLDVYSRRFDLATRMDDPAALEPAAGDLASSFWAALVQAEGRDTVARLRAALAALTPAQREALRVALVDLVPHLGVVRILALEDALVRDFDGRTADGRQGGSGATTSGGAGDTALSENGRAAVEARLRALETVLDADTIRLIAVAVTSKAALAALAPSAGAGAGGSAGGGALTGCDQDADPWCEFMGAR